MSDNKEAILYIFFKFFGLLEVIDQVGNIVGGYAKSGYGPGARFFFVFGDFGMWVGEPRA